MCLNSIIKNILHTIRRSYTTSLSISVSIYMYHLWNKTSQLFPPLLFPVALLYIASLTFNSQFMAMECNMLATTHESCFWKRVTVFVDVSIYIVLASRYILQKWILFSCDSSFIFLLFKYSRHICFFVFLDYLSNHIYNYNGWYISNICIVSIFSEHVGDILGMIHFLQNQ